MKNIIIFIYKEYSSIHDYEIEAFIHFSSKNNIQVHIYSHQFSSKILLFKDRFNAYNIYLKTYSDTSKFINNYRELQKQFNIIHLGTLQESMLGEVLNIKSDLNITTSNDILFFQNKNIQRKILSQNNYDGNIYSEVFNIGELNSKEITKHTSFPFIIKPITGEECFGVDTIDNSKDLDQYKNDFPSKGLCLVEEYLEGKIYSIDYFVSSNAIVSLTPIMQEKCAREIGINDMFIYSCISHDNLEIDFTSSELDKYIQEIVKICGIRNSFIHQEFKYTDSGFKTIEINGRIGGRRLKTLKLSYGINFLDFLIQAKETQYKCIKNVATFTIYPCKSGKLIGYNQDLLEKIQKLPSFYSLKIYPDIYIGKEISGSRDGQWNIGVIYLSHSHIEIFRKDYDFIESQYKELLIIK